MLKLRSRRAQRGLSIVEMMVGVTVGLFVVAAASMMVAGQLTSNRRLLLDTQIQQDLRASADVVARELRRAGALTDQLAFLTIWYPGVTQVQKSNADLHVDSGANYVDYAYQRNAGLATYKFWLDSTTGTLKTQISSAVDQPLNDPEVLKVTDFKITPIPDPPAPVTLVCPNPCPGTGDTSCWPKVDVRSVNVVLTGVAREDESIKRTVTVQVRVRNDHVVIDGSLSPAFKTCP